MVAEVLLTSPQPTTSEWCAYLLPAHVEVLRENQLELVASQPPDCALHEANRLLQIDHSTLLNTFIEEIGPLRTGKGGDADLAAAVGGSAVAARIYTQLINSCISANRWRLARDALSLCGALQAAELFAMDAHDRVGVVDVSVLTAAALRLAALPGEKEGGVTDDEVWRVTDLSLAILRLAMRDAAARAQVATLMIQQGDGLGRRWRDVDMNTPPSRWLHQAKADAKRIFGVTRVAETKEPKLLLSLADLDRNFPWSTPNPLA